MHRCGSACNIVTPNTVLIGWPPPGDWAHARVHKGRRAFLSWTAWIQLDASDGDFVDDCNHQLHVRLWLLSASGPAASRCVKRMGGAGQGGGLESARKEGMERLQPPIHMCWNTGFFFFLKTELGLCSSARKALEQRLDWFFFLLAHTAKAS